MPFCATLYIILNISSQNLVGLTFYSYFCKYYVALHINIPNGNNLKYNIKIEI